MTAGSGGGQPPQEAPAYSKAFEKLVNGPDDLVGLIAYALFKQSLREDAARGRPVTESHQRDPTSTTIDAFRGDAERRLQTFAAAAFEEAGPGLIQGAFGDRLDTAVATLTGTIHRRTNLGSAIWANLLAWALTVVLTIILVAAIYLPDWKTIGTRIFGGA